MMFKIYNSEGVAHVFFNSYFWGSIFLSLIALYGFYSGAGILSTISGFGYIVFASLLSLNKKFRRNPFSILFCFFTYLYLNIPAAYILIRGNDYTYGLGLSSIPFGQIDHQKDLYLGFLYLSLCWFSVWFGIVTVNTKRINIDQKKFSSIKLIPVLLIGVIVFVVTWIDHQNFADIWLFSEENKLNSILPLIFFDNAYITMTGFLLFFKINEEKGIQDSQKITILLSAIFIAFVMLQFFAGSKASILTRLMLVILFPFCFFQTYPYAKVLFPSPKFILMIGLLSFPLFYLALIQRLSLGGGIAPDFSTLLAGLSEFGINVFCDIVDQIFYRFSWGGMDRYLLVFQSFIINKCDQNTTTAFVGYLMKNMLNLLLPGTLFQEAYAPSAQLFPNVIHCSPLDGAIAPNNLILSLNTQPYTIFGIFMITFGITSPIFLYLGTLIFVLIYNKIGSNFIKLSMIYLFSAGLSSYGIEVAIGDSIHLLASILLMYFFIYILSKSYVSIPVMLRFLRANNYS